MISKGENTMKQCTKCKQWKDKSEFCMDKRRNKERSHCKKCTKISRSKVYQNRKKYYNQYSKEYASKHQEIMYKSTRKWMVANPEKRKAQKALLYAIESGKIIRQPCSVCNNPKSHGHHPDYKLPYDVIWLCAQHHKDIHREVV